MMALSCSTRSCPCPWPAASMSSSSVGRNSCSGGSRKRMVTGTALHAPRRWPRSRPAAWARAWPAPLRAAPRCRSTIISRMAGMRSASKNMCSVRHRPMPSAPKLHGLLRRRGGVGVGADLQHAVLVGPRHDAAEVAGDGGVGRWGSLRRRCCRWSRPGEIQSPS